MQKPAEGEIELKELLENKGLKLTYERKCIFEEVQRIGKHFDAEGLYERFHGRGERISKATVYRTLPLLLEAGVIQKSVGEGKQEFFEKTSGKGHHDHMVCMDCGKVIEFRDEKLEKMQDEICQQYRFKPAFHDHRIFGYCDKCHQKK